MTQCQDCGETELRMCAINTKYCNQCCECTKPNNPYYRRMK